MTDVGALLPSALVALTVWDTIWWVFLLAGYVSAWWFRRKWSEARKESAELRAELKKAAVRRMIAGSRSVSPPIAPRVDDKLVADARVDVPKSTVVVVVKHTMTRLLLAHQVQSDLRLTLAADCPTMAEAEVVLEREKPDLVIVDSTLPDGRGCDLVRRIAPRLPRTRWLVISSNAKGSLVREAVSLGVQGFVTKRSELSTMRTAVSRVLAGEKYYCVTSARALVDQMIDDSRTTETHADEREREKQASFLTRSPAEKAKSNRVILIGVHGSIRQEFTERWGELGHRPSAGPVRMRQEFTDLWGELGLTVVADCPTMAEAMIALEPGQPDLAIVGATLPDGEGCDLVRRVGAKLTRTRWLVISSNAEGSLVREAVSLGVQGFVTTHCSLAVLRGAVRCVLAGENHYCPQSAQALVDKMVGDGVRLHARLTERERAVLRGFASGKKPQALAEGLGITANEVQSHLAAIQDKLGLHEAQELVGYAIKRGYIEPP